MQETISEKEIRNNDVEIRQYFPAFKYRAHFKYFLKKMGDRQRLITACFKIFITYFIDLIEIMLIQFTLLKKVTFPTTFTGATMKANTICIRIIIIFSAFCLVYSPASFASVSGTITTTSGDLVSGALVLFTDENNPDIQYSSFTNNNGKYEISFSPTSVDEKTGSGTAPVDFVLYQNYPNPFNPGTVIPFSMYKAGFVELSVYNILGQKVRTLVYGYHSPGTYTVVWNGLDNDGRNAGAGIYMYRITAGNYGVSRKMLLLDGGSTLASGNSLQYLPQSGAASKPAVPSSNIREQRGKSAETPATYHLSITGEGIFPLSLGGIILTEEQSMNFVVSLIHYKASGMISAASGGYIELENGARVTFPENAFADDATVSVSSTDQLPPELLFSYLHPVSAAYFIDIPTPVVNTTETLSIPYDPSKLGGDAQERDIFAAHWDGRNWIGKEGAVDTESQTISIESAHFPFWSVFWVRIAEDVTVAQADSIIHENSNNPNFIILDVRTPGEFAQHIQNAVNIDYKSETFRNDIDVLDKNAVYLVYCLAGSRSAGAVEIMQELGFRKMYNMIGGIREWIMEGYPIVE